MKIPGIDVVNGGAQETWAKKISVHSNQNSFGQSTSDVLVSNTSAGSYGTLPRRLIVEQSKMFFIDAPYNTGSYYDVQNVIRILSGSNYGVNYLTSSQYWGTSWVCVSPVPALDVSNAIIAAGLSGSYPNQVRQSSINYYPYLPESGSTASPSNPSGSYWRCLNGITASISSGNSGGINYKGTYNSSTVYHIGDVIRVLSGTNAGVWIFGNAATASVVNTPPIFPEPGGSSQIWDQFSLGVIALGTCLNGVDTINYYNANLG